VFTSSISHIPLQRFSNHQRHDSTNRWRHGDKIKQKQKEIAIGEGCPFLLRVNLRPSLCHAPLLRNEEKERKTVNITKFKPLLLGHYLLHLLMLTRVNDILNFGALFTSAEFVYAPFSHIIVLAT
jgi:hypothetical protein